MTEFENRVMGISPVAKCKFKRNNVKEDFQRLFLRNAGGMAFFDFAMYFVQKFLEYYENCSISQCIFPN